MSNDVERTLAIMEAFHTGRESGISECAAGPFHYRTDTGDKHGKVVESAELPELKKDHLGWFRYEHEFLLVIHPTSKVAQVTDDLRKHLIAYAEIRGSDEHIRRQ